jgi:hypothetical protein
VVGILSRRGRATLALCVIGMRTLAGCHSYAPVSGPAPSTGTRVKVRFSEPRSVTLRLVTGQTAVRSSVREVVGTLDAVDEDSIRLSALGVVYGVTTAGPKLNEYDFKTASTVVASTNSTFRVEKLSVPRTILVVAAGIVVIAFTAFALQSSGGGGGSSY